MVFDRDIDKLSEYVRQMADGGEVYDVRDNKEGSFSILKSDIYKLALRLSEQAAVLREEKSRLGDVLSDISHQLKTPITSLAIMADLLEQDGLPPEKRREFVGNLQAGLARMDWLVKSLLKLAALDSEQGALRPCEVNVKGLVERSAAHMGPIIQAKKQNLAIGLDGAISVLCDFNWTFEAICNILKNACEHTPVGGRLTINAGESPICVWISVADTGAGIDAADFPHLFKRFYKGKNAAKESAGIGLAMSLAIMRRQNGDIEVKAKQGAGSTFTMKFYR